MMTHNDRLAKADEKGGAEFYFFYVLQFDDGTFYVGHTNAPAARWSEHAAGLSTATADRGTFRVRRALPFGTRKEAQGRVAGRISLALDTRWWSAKETRVRSGWLHGKIY